MFQAANDKQMVSRIENAKKRVIFVAPGLSRCVAKALIKAHSGQVTVTVIVDASEDVCRIGYGDVEGFRLLNEHEGITPRSQPGVRLGLLVTDGDIMFWSPTPLAVDGERKEDQPNAIVLDGAAGSGGTKETAGSGTIAKQIENNVEEGKVAEKSVERADLDKVVKKLEKNPPAPVDLARTVRVFSTKFCFVEAKLKGAECTERKISISSLLAKADLPEELLDVDLPKELQDFLATTVRPHRMHKTVGIEVPSDVIEKVRHVGVPLSCPFPRGDAKHDINVPYEMVQHDITRTWELIRRRYLKNISGFGTLVKNQDLGNFRDEAAAFEQLVRVWVEGFREKAALANENLVSDIAESIMGRIASARSRRWAVDRLYEACRENDESLSDFLKGKLRRALERMPDIEPSVGIVRKNIAPESSRDPKFLTALEEALPPEDLEGWFEEFAAARRGRRGS